MLPGGLTEDDYTILEFIANRDMRADPKTIVANTGIHKDRVNNRIKVLLKHDLLKRPNEVEGGISEKGLYEVTKLGRAYAEGDKTIDELRELRKRYTDET